MTDQGTTKGKAAPQLSKAALATRVAVLEERLRERNRTKVGSGVTSVIRTLIRCAAWVVGISFVAGKTTQVFAEVKGLAEFAEACSGISDAVSSAVQPLFYIALFLFFGLLFSGWMHWRRTKLHRSLVGQVAELRKRLELQHLPDRSTSGLTQSGETREEDDV